MFKVGDKVLLRRDAKYANHRGSNPQNTPGIVIDEISINGFEIRVQWENLECNVYKNIDLLPLIPTVNEAKFRKLLE